MFCVKCGSKLEKSWGHCSNCGAEIEQSQTPSISVNENTYKTKSPKFKLGCGGIVALVIALGVISSALNLGVSEVSNSTNTSASNEQLETPQEPWYPEGYEEYPDGLTAWKWVERGCRYSTASCVHADVVPKLGCQNLYVEVNVLDSSGAVIDWTNDTARAVNSGQVAKLEFAIFDDRAASVNLVEINCY